MKERIRILLEDVTTPAGKAVDLAIIVLILLGSLLFVVSTLPISPEYLEVVHEAEQVILVLFIVEYLLRFWVAKNRIRHFFGVYTLIDLISILPFILTFSNLQFLRIFRVFRVFRILRLLRFMRDESFLFGTVREDHFIIMRIFFTLFSIVFVGSGLIYFEEADEAKATIRTFFDAVYFTVVTITTVGFGDITPVTRGGRFVTILIILSGVVFLPWQIGTLVRKFVSTFEKKDVTCKGCGLKYHDQDAVHCKACGTLIYQEYEG